jgi:hypothetical protein
MQTITQLKNFWQAYGCKFRDFSMLCIDIVVSDLPFLNVIFKSLYYDNNEVPASNALASN